MLKFLVPLFVVMLALVPVASAQVAVDIERRVAELEEKMRMIDPAFGKRTSAQDLLLRLEQLEQKLDGVLAANGIKPVPPTPTPPVQQAVLPQTSGLAPVPN